MIEIICEYCGLYMKFSGELVKWEQFHYKCPCCYTPCEGNLKRHCPAQYLPDCSQRSAPQDWLGATVLFKAIPQDYEALNALSKEWRPCGTCGGKTA